MSERDIIIEQLGNLVREDTKNGIHHKLSYTMKRWEFELVANWVLSDRKSLVEPLRIIHTDSFKKRSSSLGQSNAMWEAIEEVLKKVDNG